MKTAYIGVDPGKSGFITIYADKQFYFYPMPTHKVETGEKLKSGKFKAKTVFHEKGLMDLSIELLKKFAGYRKIACIEEVIGRQGWSAQNNFNFGYVAGMQKMILLMLKAEIHMLRPQKWQAIMYQGIEKVKVPSSTGKTMITDTKATSALAAQKLEPSVIFSKQGVRKKDGTTHKIDDNKTDSFLMCVCASRI